MVGFSIALGVLVRLLPRGLPSREISITTRDSPQLWWPQRDRRAGCGGEYFFAISVEVETCWLIFAGEHAAGAIGLVRGGRETCAPGVMNRQLRACAYTMPLRVPRVALARNQRRQIL